MIESKNQVGAEYISGIETIEKESTLIRTDKPNYDNFTESLHFQKDMDTIEQRVLSILRGDKFARKQDWWLIILYWAKMGYIKIMMDENNLNKITPPESITRVKRKLIESAKKGNKELAFLLKDKENIEIREEHEEMYRGYYQDKNSEEKARRVK